MHRIRFVTEKGDRLLDLGADMLKPTNGSHDFGRPVLQVDESSSDEFFLVSLLRPPNPEQNLHLRPQPLDSPPEGNSVAAFHRYSTANGYPFSPHRFGLFDYFSALLSGWSPNEILYANRWPQDAVKHDNRWREVYKFSESELRTYTGNLVHTDTKQSTS